MFHTKKFCLQILSKHQNINKIFALLTWSILFGHYFLQNFLGPLDKEAKIKEDYKSWKGFRFSLTPPVLHFKGNCQWQIAQQWQLATWQVEIDTCKCLFVKVTWKAEIEKVGRVADSLLRFCISKEIATGNMPRGRFKLTPLAHDLSGTLNFTLPKWHQWLQLSNLSQSWNVEMTPANVCQIWNQPPLQLPNLS